MAAKPKTGKALAGAGKAKGPATKTAHKTKAVKKAAAKKAAPAKGKGKPSRRAKKFVPRVAGDVEAMFKAFQAREPEPKGELEHVNAFTLLVAVVLSAQATDAGVNKATRALFAAADTAQKMVALGEDRVRDYVKTIGLFRNKAKNVIALSEKLIADHGGEVPADRDYLVTLPGVGRKTANVVLSMAFGQKTMAVDTHVFRVAHRLGLSNGATPDAVEDDLMALIPDAYLYHAHHWLILHGRYTCLARGPKCDACPIATLCSSDDKRV